MCPASHEGVVVKLLHRGIPRSEARSNFRAIQASSKAELSSLQGLPCEPHIRRDCVPTTVPHSGRESSRRAAPLFETALSRQAGQR
jgi:hypothetical protein